MSDELPPFVTDYTDRHGKTRYRYRKKGQPSRSLPGHPGEPRFRAAYAAAVEGLPTEGRQQPKGPAARTFRAAWVEIRKTYEWSQLKDSSRQVQTLIAERFLQSPIAPGEKTSFGEMPIAGMRRGDVKKILARYNDRPHAGDGVLRFLRKACLIALDNEWIEADPTYRIKYKPKLIGHRAWSDAELVQFEARWAVGTRERLGYALALYTGQRRADVAAMQWGAYDGAGIAVVQEKTAAPLWVPAHPDLKTILDGMDRTGGAILQAGHGSRFVTESFGNLMADAIAAAGLPDECRLHGLRKSAGRCLAEAGATSRQIMAVLGHKTLSEAERYTREAEQKGLAQQGMDHWAKPRFVTVK